MPGNELVQSLARGLDLLCLTIESDNGLSITDIVNATGLRRSTAHNLMRTLVSREFVAKTNGIYRAGPAIHVLAAFDTSGEFLRKAEEAVMQLAKRYPSSIVSFSESIGGKIFARVMKYPQKMLPAKNAGVEMLPYQTATGLVILAYADPETRQTIQIHHPFQIEGITLWESEEKLERYLAVVRETGYALPPFCSESRHKLAALPSISHHGRVLGVFGVAWNQTEDDSEEVIASMREAARRLQSMERGGTRHADH
jgi:DNA-binding IclR family transcriptional regulator